MVTCMTIPSIMFLTIEPSHGVSYCRLAQFVLYCCLPELRATCYVSNPSSLPCLSYLLLHSPFPSDSNSVCTSYHSVDHVALTVQQLTNHTAMYFFLLVANF